MQKKRKRTGDLLQEKKQAVENIEAAEETLDLHALKREKKRNHRDGNES